MAIDQQPKSKPGGGTGSSSGSDPSLQKGRNFLQEVLVELKKTHWPTKQEANRLTLVVIGVILALGIYMGLLDTMLSLIFNKGFLK